MRRRWKSVVLLAIVGVALIALEYFSIAQDFDSQRAPSWNSVRSAPMSGGLRVFWNVRSGDPDHNNAEAVQHGFELVDLLNTYSDYPGRGAESVYRNLDFGGREKEEQYRGLAVNRSNPWKRPDFFERIIKRNIGSTGGHAIFVNDIEFRIERDPANAWHDLESREASGEATQGGFRTAYFREWAQWFYLPCKWAKEQHPTEPVGLYGAQPFRVDYWGVYGKSEQQMNELHQDDAELWQWIEPYVDFYTASVYVPYDTPDSLYFMATNVEENYIRGTRRSSKPLYAYIWLRYHSSAAGLAGRELKPYQAEAAAVLPYFGGARGVVLWGAEPQSKEQPYRMLPVFMDSLARVSELSAKMGKAELVVDEPARVLWNEKRPLVRKLKVSESEWIVLAANPWQNENDTATLDVTCGAKAFRLPVHGRHSEIYHIVGDQAQRMPVPSYPLT
jgi:hypothetical protein